MTAAIKTSNLCKHYPGFSLNNVSFSIPMGVCCGFVGPNGAGKTTTLKALLGMVHKDSGEIKLLGKDNGDAGSKENIGVMFDQPYFQEDWTPLDMLSHFSDSFHAWLTSTIAWSYNNPLIICGLMILTAALILSASYLLSLRFYTKREL